MNAARKLGTRQVKQKILATVEMVDLPESVIMQGDVELPAFEHWVCVNPIHKRIKEIMDFSNRPAPHIKTLTPTMFIDMVFSRYRNVQKILTFIGNNPLYQEDKTNAKLVREKVDILIKSLEGLSKSDREKKVASLPPVKKYVDVFMITEGQKSGMIHYMHPALAALYAGFIYPALGVRLVEDMRDDLSLPQEYCQQLLLLSSSILTESGFHVKTPTLEDMASVVGVDPLCLGSVSMMKYFHMDFTRSKMGYRYVGLKINVNALKDKPVTTDFMSDSLTDLMNNLSAKADLAQKALPVLHSSVTSANKIHEIFEQRMVEFDGGESFNAILQDESRKLDILKSMELFVQANVPEIRTEEKIGFTLELQVRESVHAYVCMLEGLYPK